MAYRAEHILRTRNVANGNHDNYIVSSMVSGTCINAPDIKNNYYKIQMWHDYM